MPKRTRIFRVTYHRSRRQLKATVTLPRLGLANKRQSIDRFVSWSLVILGIVGIGYVLAPSFVQPANVTVVQRKTPATQAVPKDTGLQRSIPTHLDIPDIGLSTDLTQVGKNADGSLEVPPRYDIAGWYRYSPTPGEIGPSVIAGHVDNYLGPAVFFYLKDLQPGQLVKVTREDESIVTFHVDRVALFDQQAFPTDEVYGNIDYPGLRLITCGGVYNALSGHYSHNVVVYASRA